MRSLVRSNPNVEMRRLQNEFDRLFNGFFPTQANGDEEAPLTWAPRVDLGETDDAYRIHLDLPGLSKEDLNIDFHDGRLTVSGERKATHQDEGTNYVRIERRTGHFFRSFTLPKAVEMDGIEANYENGVLSIHIPKAEDSKPRRISVS